MADRSELTQELAEMQQLMIVTRPLVFAPPLQLSHFLPQQLGPENSHQVLKQIKKVIGEVLQKVATDDKKRQTDR